jgi:hypothetical protein
VEDHLVAVEDHLAVAEEAEEDKNSIEALSLDKKLNIPTKNEKTSIFITRRLIFYDSPISRNF